MSYATKTEKGPRIHNEDNCLALQFDLGVFLAVADGMGGHSAGAVASELTVKSVYEGIRSPHSDNCEALLKELFKNANRTVFSASKQAPNYAGMGTTLVCAIAKRDMFFAANVGDSRLYLYRNASGVLFPVTVDHSYVQELVNLGLITAEEARVHPHRNLITRAVGTADLVDLDLFFDYLYDDDILILCSDGLHGVVGESELLDAIKRKPDVDSLCDELIRLALENDSRDNITVAIYKNDGGCRHDR
ncbi:MAG: Stp1/IreP family PP2C-type Ser/Thr phosphatase [Clostridia bacterium]|nr:Stp1/IreP family PP2C-type Ser/Thr phosphatase [Clostridia bacterium]